MVDVEWLMLSNQQKMKDYREFNTKSKIRLTIFAMLWFLSYLVCTISLFFWKWYVVSAFSFIFLFLLIYFLALDCYRIKFQYVLLILFLIFLFETLSFVILLWFSRYLVIELILFNVAVWTLLFLLTRNLNNSTWFSPFSYFTQWWFFIISLLTIFFCVLLMWKYTQIPFTCDDIQSFPTKVVKTTVNPLKKTRNKILSWFGENTNEMVNESENIPELYVIWNPLSKSKELASADSLESFFMNIRNSIQTETLDLKAKASKATCNRYLSVLQRTQKNWWVQIVWIIIWYLLLVWVFKILFWIVSIVWVILFIILRIFWVYKYEKRMVEKEVIV